MPIGIAGPLPLGMLVLWPRTKWRNEFSGRLRRGQAVMPRAAGAVYFLTGVLLAVLWR